MAPDTQHIRKKFNPLFIHVIAWTIIFLFPLLFFERFESMRRMHDFNLLKFYIQPLCIALIFYINYLWLIDKVLFQKKPIRFIIYNLLLIVLTNIISFLVHRMMVPPEVIHWRPGIIPPPRPGLMQWQDAITLALSVGLSVAIKMTQKWIISEKERKQLEQERTEAELKNLKNQLNPHFLFNTLNNIYSLIAISPDRAQSAVLELSKMLRYVLYENTQHYVPIEKELEFNQNYIELMRLRLARHVKTEVNIPQGLCRGYKIAPLLFITLIENAFKHGTSATEDSFVSITMREPSQGVIECHIENSCFPKDKTDKSGSGIGLKNLSRQLELLYPEKHSFHTESDTHIYRATLTIDLN
ncbi:MAG TPA: histidine kinase [Candidatus Barnesiella excrementigallinarum]|nr:histidine kinase [Candidatus Barnesiella excrementigallinarum]